MLQSLVDTVKKPKNSIETFSFKQKWKNFRNVQYSLGNYNGQMTFKQVDLSAWSVDSQ